jgi:hypothetical protein
MPAGPALINAVESVLTDVPATQHTIRCRLPGAYSPRAVRYAIAALVKEGKAKRKGHRGYYVARNDNDR